ncbi:MAG: MoaD/ThiS family protein [Anaerolineales bacterium]|nr:MoaD/ThiS family protein [Anaerolineales bacterium]
MPVLRIPTPLRAYTSGQSEVNVAGAKISEALTDLTAQYPTLKPHLFNDNGGLRPFVNLFVGEHNIKDLQGVDTPIKDGDKIMLIPSIAGGCRSEGDVLSPEAISTHNEIALSQSAKVLLATTFFSRR